MTFSRDNNGFSNQSVVSQLNSAFSGLHKNSIITPKKDAKIRDIWKVFVFVIKFKNQMFLSLYS